MAPSRCRIVPVMFIAAQLVGLNMKSGRLIVTFTGLICRGIVDDVRDRIRPGWVGRDRQSAVTGLISIFARTTMQSHGGHGSGLVSCSRSNGPALTGFVIDKPNGAPS